MTRKELQNRLRWLVRQHKAMSRTEPERADRRYGNLIRVTHKRLMAMEG